MSAMQFVTSFKIDNHGRLIESFLQNYSDSEQAIEYVYHLNSWWVHLKVTHQGPLTIILLKSLLNVDHRLAPLTFIQTNCL